MTIRRPHTSARRRGAARLLLGVFVVAAQLAPVGHLATHRNDHTHGPELAGLANAAHEAAHRSGLAHSHGPESDELTAEELAWLFPNGAPDAPVDSGNTPAHDHGRESVSHFGLALLQGPPPPLVPPPAEAVTPQPDIPLSGHVAPPLPQPPARGPPA